MLAIGDPAIPYTLERQRICETSHHLLARRSAIAPGGPFREVRTHMVSIASEGAVAVLLTAEICHSVWL